MKSYKIASSLALATFMVAGCSNPPKQEARLDKSSYTHTSSANVFSQPIKLSNELDGIHAVGKSFFRIPWVEAPSATTARDGLGPLFSANTCVHCHPGNGAGMPIDKNGKITRALVLRLSKRNIKNINNNLTMKNGFTQEPTYGGQLSINGTSDTPYEGVANVSYETIKGKYSDGTPYELRNPHYSITDLQYGPLDKDANIAPHIALALIGLGKIEAIPQKQILANEDINDKDADGISGKANWVYNPESNATELGRFTWKAAAATVKHQSANAAHNDMGLSNPLFPKHNCTDKQQECLDALEGRYEFDLTGRRLDAITYYLKTLKIPAQREHKNFAKGEEIFKTIGCNKCHTPSFVINGYELIEPYSDFLLHDMGDALSDGHTMFKATANEFRTPPLWGIGLYKRITGHTPLLHDGRARGIEEAILWHGGEAKNQQEAFKALNKQDRSYLVDFLGAI